MNFNELPQFQKEFKQLTKEYRSLSQDLEQFRKIVLAVPSSKGKHFHTLHEADGLYILKARLFCKYLRGSSLRIIYAYQASMELIEFIELYFKGDKENHDIGRICEHLKQYGSHAV